jgi:outer membrane protein TolC
MGTHSKRLERKILQIGALVTVCFAVAACKTSYYHKKADKEVYQIIEDIENQVFGKTNTFSIDTAFSSRKPSEIEPAEIIESRQEAAKRKLNIEEALELAIQNSREFQTEKERLYLSALSLSGERWEFSPQFLARSTVARDRSSNGDQTGSVGSRVTVGQALTTGASIGATLANDLLRFYTGDPRRSAVSTLSLNVVQPLLRGAGSAIAREGLKQAERDVIYAVRDFSQFQMEFSVNIVSQYFELLQQRDIVRNRFTDYESRTDATARLEGRFAAGLETAVGVGQARQAELSSRNGYVNTVANYETRIDQFKIQLGIPLTHELQLDDSELAALSEIGLLETTIDSTIAFGMSVKNHLQLLNDIDRFEDSRRQVKIVANRLKPGLDFFADASLTSDRPTDYANFDINDVRAGAGFEIDLPINRFRERNQYRATLVNFERSVRTLGLVLDQKRNFIERGLRTLTQLRENYRIQTLAVALAEERVTSADLNIQAGRAVVRDLVEAQNELLAAKNSLSAALVDYLSARLQLFLDIGILNTESERYWLEPNPTTTTFSTKTEETVTTDDKAVTTPDALFEE